MRNVVHICTFQSAPNVTKKTTYKNLKKAVLAAGRFSVFEATDTPRAAEMYDRLCQDPSVETFSLGFPWTGVRSRGS